MLLTKQARGASLLHASMLVLGGPRTNVVHYASCSMLDMSPRVSWNVYSFLLQALVVTSGLLRSTCAGLTTFGLVVARFRLS